MAAYLLTWRIRSCSVEFINPWGRIAAPDALTGWCLQMEMLIGGRWQPAASGRTEDVTSPFDGTVSSAEDFRHPARPALVKEGRIDDDP